MNCDSFRFIVALDRERNREERTPVIIRYIGEI